MGVLGAALAVATGVRGALAVAAVAGAPRTAEPELEAAAAVSPSRMIWERSDSSALPESERFAPLDRDFPRRA
eukprot:766861-Alexandrium_andersonii.AAC.1